MNHRKKLKQLLKSIPAKTCEQRQQDKMWKMLQNKWTETDELMDSLIRPNKPQLNDQRVIELINKLKEQTK